MKKCSKLASLIAMTFIGSCFVAFAQQTTNDFVQVKGVSITGTETWVPESKIFVSGRSFTIRDLLVCDHEVTRGEYKDIIGSYPSMAQAYDKNGNRLAGDAALNNPVTDVSWYDAIVYCNKRSIKEGFTPCYSISGKTNPDEWGTVPTANNSTWDNVVCNFDANGYRLPTEAEWEWLSRGGQGYKYAGSDTIDNVAWYYGTTDGTRDVKTKSPNGYGLYDMSGNVWEWCWDWYERITTSTPETGATTGSNRCQRGGSWNDNFINCTVDYRIIYFPYYRGKLVGLRVVRTNSQ